MAGITFFGEGRDGGEGLARLAGGVVGCVALTRSNGSYMMEDISEWNHTYLVPETTQPLNQHCFDCS